MKDAQLLCSDFFHLVRPAHYFHYLFSAGTKLYDLRPLLFLNASNNWCRLLHRRRDHWNLDFGRTGGRWSRRLWQRCFLAEVKEPRPEP